MSNTNTQIVHDDEHLSTLLTTAGKIRYLATIYVNTDGSIDRGRIGKILGIRYQWVRNVLITPIKK